MYNRNQIATDPSKEMLMALAQYECQDRNEYLGAILSQARLSNSRDEETFELENEYGERSANSNHQIKPYPSA